MSPYHIANYFCFQPQPSPQLPLVSNKQKRENEQEIKLTQCHCEIIYYINISFHWFLKTLHLVHLDLHYFLVSVTLRIFCSLRLMNWNARRPVFSRQAYRNRFNNNCVVYYLTIQLSFTSLSTSTQIELNSNLYTREFLKNV